MSEPEAPASDSTTRTPGQQLAAARAGCGLSVADAARQLKLSPWQIEAMEADHYERLPGAVFARGFIRNYARLIQLDAAPLLASVEHQLPQPVQSAPEVPPSADIPFPTGREIKWQRYAIVVLVLLVPVVMFEFYRDEAPAVTVKSRPVALPVPHVVADAKRETAAVVLPMPQVVADAKGEAAPVAPKPARLANVPAQPGQPAKAAPVEHKPGEHTMRLVFEKESWVEIRDRHGRRIFSQLNSAGTEQVVSGVPPLSLVVGNAAGVRLKLNEQLVDLAPHTKIDVARFTLE